MTENKENTENNNFNNQGNMDNHLNEEQWKTDEQVSKEEQLEVTPEGEEAEEKDETVHSFETIVAELEHNLATINDKYLRLSAEFDNYRKRTLREKMELIKTANETVMRSVLPLIDDFERAIKSMEQGLDLEATKEGINLIYNKFRDFSAQNGVKEIEALGQPFNTDVHEAVTKIPAPSEDMKGKILDVIQKGYFLNDKVIRFAKVVVGE